MVPRHACQWARIIFSWQTQLYQCSSQTYKMLAIRKGSPSTGKLWCSAVALSQASNDLVNALGDYTLQAKFLPSSSPRWPRFSQHCEWVLLSLSLSGLQPGWTSSSSSKKTLRAFLPHTVGCVSYPGFQENQHFLRDTFPGSPTISVPVVTGSQGISLHCNCISGIQYLTSPPDHAFCKSQGRCMSWLSLYPRTLAQCQGHTISLIVSWMNKWIHY